MNYAHAKEVLHASRPWIRVIKDMTSYSPNLNYGFIMWNQLNLNRFGCKKVLDRYTILCYALKAQNGNSRQGEWDGYKACKVVCHVQNSPFDPGKDPFTPYGTMHSRGGGNTPSLISPAPCPKFSQSIYFLTITIHQISNHNLIFRVK